jgi:hypothetical protein
LIRPQEHTITDVNVIAPDANDDEMGLRFTIELRTAGDKTLRLKLPLQQIDALARALLALAYDMDLPGVQPSWPWSRLAPIRNGGTTTWRRTR